jgi:hypothetical protein
VVTDSPNVAALSYIGVQVFGHTHLRWFTHIPPKTAQLYTRQFALLPRKYLLLCLRSTVETNETQTVRNAQNDFLEFERCCREWSRLGQHFISTKRSRSIIISVSHSIYVYTQEQSPIGGRHIMAGSQSGHGWNPRFRCRLLIRTKFHLAEGESGQNCLGWDPASTPNVGGPDISSRRPADFRCVLNYLNRMQGKFS